MKRILLADDETNLRLLVRTTIEGPDYEIVEAGDGNSTLRLAKEVSPDVLIVDWMMPGSTGIEVTQALRGDPATASIPIIMLTSKGQHVDRERGIAAGVSAYLTKPFSPLLLLEKIEELIAGNVAAAPAPDFLDVADGDGSDNPVLGQLKAYALDLQRAITAERERRRQLSDAHVRLKVLDRLKTDFLDFISHELRTPLHQLTAVTIFDQSAESAENAELLHIAQKGYRRLETLMLKGLEYFQWLATERIEAAEPIDLPAVLTERAGRMLYEHGSSASIDVRLRGAGFRTVVKEEHLAQVLDILLSNALKFSCGEAPVDIDVHSSGGELLVTITDCGTGFPTELARGLFEPFSTVDPMAHDRGSGLNLAIAKAIVEAYGGWIRGSSDGTGSGATFTVSMPKLAIAPDRLASETTFDSPPAIAERRFSVRGGPASFAHQSEDGLALGSP